MRRPRLQFRLWVIFAVTALVAYLCLWYTTFRHYKNNPDLTTEEYRQWVDEVQERASKGK
jgi:hypothetical protein